jgi:hypothetical protein
MPLQNLLPMLDLHTLSDIGLDYDTIAVLLASIETKKAQLEVDPHGGLTGFTFRQIASIGNLPLLPS